MRIAIIADVHGNLTALEAVLEDVRRRAPDRIMHGGDLVLMGCRPAEVIDRVRELGVDGVVGNTDELLWRPEELAHQERLAPKLTRHLRVMFDDCAPATRELLGDERIAWLGGLPQEARIDGVAIVHAAPGDLWRAPMPDVADAELAETYLPLDADTAIYGHIHRPFIRAVDAMTVANCGSVGMPWDGDPRASYLMIEDGAPHLMRVAYDVGREVASMRSSGYPDAARLAEMRRRGRFVAAS